MFQNTSVSTRPDSEKFYLLISTLWLTILLSKYLDFNAGTVAIPILGLWINLSPAILVPSINAGITASGVSWLFFNSPTREVKESWTHLFLPALTTLAIQFPLMIIPPGLGFWVIYFSGCALLLCVIYLEYLSTEPQSKWYAWTATALTAFSFSLYLSMVTLLRSSGTRLVFLLPMVGLTTFLVCLRTFNLRISSQRTSFHAFMVAWMAAQLAAALHYLPFPPVKYGLTLLGFVYATTNFIFHIEQGESTRQAAKESLALLTLVLLVAHWVG